MHIRQMLQDVFLSEKRVLCVHVIFAFFSFQPENPSVLRMQCILQLRNVLANLRMFPFILTGQVGKRVIQVLYRTIQLCKRSGKLIDHFADGNARRRKG